MRIILSLLAAACGLGGPSADEPTTTGEAQNLTGQRADTDVAGLEAALTAGAQLIDVRTQAEYDAGHVQGAVHIPLGFTTTDPAIQALDASAPVYVICQSGGRSARAADQLAAAGFHAVNVRGGTGGWRASGRPVVP